MNVTQCPICNTRFKVRQEQLDARQGLVRCGRCQAVFDATEHLQDDQPSPQLDLPIEAEIPQPASAPPPVEEPPPVPAEPPFFAEPDSAGPNPAERDAAEIAPEKTEPGVVLQPVSFGQEYSAPLPAPARQKPVWPWVMVSLLMAVVLLAQAAYFFRVEIAAGQPGLRPALLAYCNLLRCTVPLPQKAGLLSVEASELEADPLQNNFITLHALLHNRAPHVQAYPHIQLTLTDAQDSPLARRILEPGDYLKPEDDEAAGMAADKELVIKLDLDTTDLQPSGYRLTLFYP